MTAGDISIIRIMYQWAHQKVQIDWMSIGNKTVNLVLAPTLKNTHRGKCDKTPDKQNIAEAILASGVSLLLKNFLEG